MPDVDEPVHARVPGIGFDDEHNASVTWAHLLQQTSEWQGVCFGLPDEADHYRYVKFGKEPDGKKGEQRSLRTPGIYWACDEVRNKEPSPVPVRPVRRRVPQAFT